MHTSSSVTVHRVAWAVLGLLLLVRGDARAQQAEPPTFRADTYTVSFEVSITRGGLFRRSSPYTGLQVSDFGILMDGKVFDAHDVKEVRPGAHASGPSGRSAEPLSRSSV
jgi:hypothetical protein